SRRDGSQTSTTSPPFPPSPPSGPPRGTWASRRNEMHPSPPRPPSTQIFAVSSTAAQLLVGENADRATLARRVEGDLPFARREDRVIAAEADALAGPEARAALAHDDLAAGHLLAGEHLDAEHVRVGFAPVPGRTETFLMCHVLGLLFLRSFGGSFLGRLFFGGAA